MDDDSVIRDAYKVKDELARRYGNDVRRLGRAVLEEQRKSGRKVVSPPRKQHSR